MAGKEVEIAEGVFARPPETGDESNALAFFNSLVDEDAMISYNRRKTVEEEARWLFEKLVQISEGEAVFYFAVERKGGRIVGGAEAKLGRMRESHVATIGLSVSAECRRQGIGEGLLNLVLSEARERLGARIATLKVFSINGPAIALYRKLGFSEEGRLRGQASYKGEFVDELVMSRRLLPLAAKGKD